MTRTSYLTPRQAEVMAMLASGLTAREIAAHTHYAYETIRWHVRCIYRALGVHSRAEAIHAYQAGEQAGAVIRCPACHRPLEGQAP